MIREIDTGTFKGRIRKTEGGGGNFSPMECPFKRGDGV